MTHPGRNERNVLRKCVLKNREKSKKAKSGGDKR